MLDRENNELDEAFRKALLGREEEAPHAAGWFTLKAKLAQEGVKIGLGKTVVKFLQLSVAAVVTVGTGIGVYIYTSNTNKNTATQQASTIAETITTPSDISNTDASSTKNTIETTASTQENSIEKNIRANTITISTVENNNTHPLTASISKSNASANITPASTKRTRSSAVVKTTRNANTNEYNTTAAETNKEEIATVEKPEVRITEVATLESTESAKPDETTLLAKPTVDADSAISTDNLTLATNADDKTLTAVIDSTETVAENNIILIDTSYKRIVVGIYASYDYNYYDIKSGNNELTGGVSDFGSAIKGKASGNQFTVGFTGGYKASQRTLIEGGLLYSQKKQIDYTSAVYSVNSTPGDSLGLAANQFNYQHKARYVQLSIKAKFYLVDIEKIRLFVAPGMMFESNIPTAENKQSYYQFTSTNINKSTVKKYRFEPGSVGSSALIAAGVEFKLPNNWLVSVEPAYIYGLNQIIRYKGSDNVSPIKHYNRSICLGLRIMKEF